MANSQSVGQGIGAGTTHKSNEEPEIREVARIKKNPQKKYFWKDIYAGSIPSVHAELQRVKAALSATNLQLLDQQSLSQETVVNALFIYAAQLLDEKKLPWLEKELAPAFARLSEMTAEDMKTREGVEKGAEGGKLPEGFTQPKGQSRGKGPKKGRPGPGGRNAE